MARRLATIAREINADLNGFTAEVIRGYACTDRKVGRLRIPGKGRHGSRLVVRNADGNVVLDHNSAEPYRRNDEVEAWLAKLKDTIDKQGPDLRTFCPHCRVKLQRDLMSVQKLDYNNWGWCIEEGPGQGQAGISGSKAQAWRTARRQAINEIRRDHGLENRS